MGMDVKRLYERVPVSTALYDTGTGSMEVADKILNVMETRCLSSSMCEVMHMDSVRNKDLQRRTRVMRWFRHMK